MHETGATYGMKKKIETQTSITSDARDWCNIWNDIVNYIHKLQVIQKPTTSATSWNFKNYRSIKLFQLVE